MESDNPKQETLEKAERMYTEKQVEDAYDKGVKDAAERMYSEEDLKTIIMIAHTSFSSIAGNFDEWFEQFKKK